MKRSDRIRRENVSLVTSNLHCHCRRAGKQRREEDLILYDDVRTRRWLPGSVSSGSIAGTGGGGGETIPEVELLFCDSWLAGLVGLYVVREEITPVVMRHVVNVVLGSLWNTLFFYGADIV